MNPATEDLLWETYLNKYADFPELVPLRWIVLYVYMYINILTHGGGVKFWK
jgi:hypothetical protein